MVGVGAISLSSLPFTSLCASMLMESLERVPAEVFFKFVDINTFAQFR